MVGLTKRAYFRVCLGGMVPIRSASFNPGGFTVRIFVLLAGVGGSPCKLAVSSPKVRWLSADRLSDARCTLHARCRDGVCSGGALLAQNDLLAVCTRTIWIWTL